MERGKRRKITALTVAGSDSAGGAGIQADVKAMEACGVHCACVVTAVTAQNTVKVSEVFPIPKNTILAQFESVLSDFDIKAAKTGMLYSPETVRTVAGVFGNNKIPLVVDPVTAAGVGGSLSRKGLAEAIKEELLPLGRLVTPNRYEAELLTGFSVRTEDDAVRACEKIGEICPVYLKGGHMETETVTDYLYDGSELIKTEYPRIGVSGHGSGCVLSSFITAHLASGTDLKESVLKSRAMIQKSIETQYSAGKGGEIVNPDVSCE